ncbi:hypothetical protein C1H46_042655 [Malus baccata]|uniref:Uncharacterized protein n=1 Tax=Malus baccata TaxID=106549 RepID=A0A540KC44_MALBA|nr:hypothetical protein C1H46_042655 [Malus baccata]
MQSRCLMECQKEELRTQCLIFSPWMEQFKSGLALNEYTNCALRALRAIGMLRFLLDEGCVRELQNVEAVFRQLFQLTETSIKIVSDQLSIVDITLLYPVSLELTLLANMLTKVATCSSIVT